MNDDRRTIEDDVRTLHRLGYAQELLRRMSGFSNFAVSLSIICILAGGVTSFHLGLGSVGGASIGLGWPLACLFSLVVAVTMGQVASAFPTAGGLYHWASILGGKGWGWGTAWFNLAGLITVLAAINVGAYQFTVGALGPALGFDPAQFDDSGKYLAQLAGVCLITATQALFNHLGIRVTSLLIDFSGWWILVVSTALTLALFGSIGQYDLDRIWTFTNYSGDAGANVWPGTTSLLWLFAVGLLLPAYTITGFDASAHVAEETVGAAANVPRGMVRSVLVSGLFGWVMLCAVVLAAPNLNTAAAQGDRAFVTIVQDALPSSLALLLFGGIAVAQYLCGLATVTSASRMAYAFARDGGLPASAWLRRVNPRFRTPDIAIWVVAAATVLFTVYTPVYSTITAVCVIFLYVSYVLPTALGYFAHGRTWTVMGPWHVGPLYRPLAVVSVVGCVALIVIGMQPPNEKAIWVVGSTAAALTVVWFAYARYCFEGPPQGVMIQKRQAEIAATERALEQAEGGQP